MLIWVSASLIGFETTSSVTFGNTLSKSGLTARKELASRLPDEAKWTMVPPTSACTSRGTNCAASVAPSAVAAEAFST